jgi:DNA primase
MSAADRFRDRLSKPDILSVIGQEVKLRKAGHNYLGLCPFHSEKSPSFTVSPEKQKFHCYGCGEHGDVVDFIQKSRDVDFKAALSILGIRQDSLPRVDPARERRRDRLKAYRQWKEKTYDQLCRESIRLHKIDMAVRKNPAIPEELAWKVVEITARLPIIEHRLDVFISKDEVEIFNLFEEMS